MDSKIFAEKLIFMKETGRMVDAACKDKWAVRNIPFAGLFREEAGSELQSQLEKLLQEYELTEDQLAALETVTFNTPTEPNPSNYGVSKFKVVMPLTGPYEQISKLPDTERFLMNLEGMGRGFVQGVNSIDIPVRLERPKTTNKK